MKRLLLNASILALLIGGIAGAQTILQSVQMSQDPRGPIALDTQQNIYLPGHVNNSGKTPTVAGTGSPTIVGTDAAGTITMGTSATTATVTFATAYNSNPSCVAASQTSLATPITFTPVTNTLSITQNSTSGNKVSYVCMSVN